MCNQGAHPHPQVPSLADFRFMPDPYTLRTCCGAMIAACPADQRYYPVSVPHRPWVVGLHLPQQFQKSNGVRVPWSPKAPQEQLGEWRNVCPEAAARILGKRGCLQRGGGLV